MFGTVFRMQASPGKKDELLRVMMDEQRDVKGMISSYVYRTAGDEVWGAAVFEDERTYRANAADPEQDKWYRRVRALLAADPEWHDGEILAWPGGKA